MLYSRWTENGVKQILVKTDSEMVKKWVKTDSKMVKKSRKWCKTDSRWTDFSVKQILVKTEMV